MLNLTNLIDDAKCYQTVRQMRWPQGISCPKCNCQEVINRGKDETQPHRQRYQCKGCSLHFDDLSDTMFAGHHQPLRIWILCLYFMGLNLSNEQIAQELDLDKDDVYKMTSQLRTGIAAGKPEVKLSGEVECDEVYVTEKGRGARDEGRGKERKTSPVNWSEAPEFKREKDAKNLCRGCKHSEAQGVNIKSRAFQHGDSLAPRLSPLVPR